MGFHLLIKNWSEIDLAKEHHHWSHNISAWHVHFKELELCGCQNPRFHISLIVDRLRIHIELQKPSALLQKAFTLLVPLLRHKTELALAFGSAPVIELQKCCGCEQISSEVSFSEDQPVHVVNGPQQLVHQQFHLFLWHVMPTAWNGQQYTVHCFHTIQRTQGEHTSYCSFRKELQKKREKNVKYFGLTPE